MVEKGLGSGKLKSRRFGELVHFVSLSGFDIRERYHRSWRWRVICVASLCVRENPIFFVYNGCASARTKIVDFVSLYVPSPNQTRLKVVFPNPGGV